MYNWNLLFFSLAFDLHPSYLIMDLFIVWFFLKSWQTTFCNMFVTKMPWINEMVEMFKCCQHPCYQMNWTIIIELTNVIKFKCYQIYRWYQIWCCCQVQWSSGNLTCHLNIEFKLFYECILMGLGLVFSISNWFALIWSMVLINVLFFLSLASIIDMNIDDIFLLIPMLLGVVVQVLDVCWFSHVL